MNTKTTVISQTELEIQFAFCDRIAALWQSENRTPTAYVETYGCQQNEADSEKLRGYLTMSGYTIVKEAEGADVVVMNTCAIREHAEQRVFGNLGALTHTKRRHPEQKIFLNSADKDALVTAAVKKIDQAAAKGIIHKNNAARKKSALVLKANKA